jgi:MATE family multidrug resistance protein
MRSTAAKSTIQTELRRLFRLAAPLAAAQAGTNLMGLVDVAVLGRLGARELAGAGLGNALFFAFSIMGTGMVMGVDPLISQAVGAGDRVRARNVLWQGIWLALLVAGTLTLVLIGCAAALSSLGATPELVSPARTFLLVRMLSLMPFMVFYALRSYLQGLHVTRPLLISMVVANIANFLLDLLFVFGGSRLPTWTGPLHAMPAMGVAGAALATVFCTTLQMAIAGYAAYRISVPGEVDHRWNQKQMAQAFRVGLPLSLQMGAEVGIFALVGIMASRLGTLHLAAHQLVISVASFTFTVALGVAAAGSVRVGHSIGARDASATRTAGRAAFIAGAIVMGISGLSFAIFPRAIARLVTNHEDVIAASLPLMLVAAVFQLSDGIQAVGAGVLRGAGDTKWAFYANLFGHWCVGLPVALWLGFHMGLGIVGLWWGLCAGLTVVAVLLFLRFERLSRDEIRPI